MSFDIEVLGQSIIVEITSYSAPTPAIINRLPEDCVDSDPGWLEFELTDDNNEFVSMAVDGSNCLQEMIEKKLWEEMSDYEDEPDEI